MKLTVLIKTCLILCLCAGVAPVSAVKAQGQPVWHFIHNGPEGSKDHRYDYHWRVLQAALDATVKDFGPYRMTSAKYMSETRQILEMQNRRGMINTLVHDSTNTLENNLYPVKIPIDKGIIGYRVFLIRSEDQPRFASVQSLEDLKRFSIGQGADWSEVDIYRAAGFKVVPAATYESLFPMLAAKRFDAIGRGVSEIANEMAMFGEAYPDMMIENSLLVYYPMPEYFFFPKTDEGLRYARRVTAGMQLLVQNGTLDRMFKEEFGKVLASLNLRHRRLFRIANPTLTTSQPYDNLQYWYTPGS